MENMHQGNEETQLIINQTGIDTETKADLAEAKRKEFENMDKKGSQSRSALYNEGYETGYNSAAEDYVNQKVNLELFEREKTQEDITDFFAIGFENGYVRKL